MGHSDGEMFTASQYEFRSSPDIRRNFPFPTLRTEEAPTRWLLGEYTIIHKYAACYFCMLNICGKIIISIKSLSKIITLLEFMHHN